MNSSVGIAVCACRLGNEAADDYAERHRLYCCCGAQPLIDLFVFSEDVGSETTHLKNRPKNAIKSD